MQGMRHHLTALLAACTIGHAPIYTHHKPMYSSVSFQPVHAIGGTLGGTAQPVPDGLLGGGMGVGPIGAGQSAFYHWFGLGVSGSSPDLGSKLTLIPDVTPPIGAPITLQSFTFPFTAFAFNETPGLGTGVPTPDLLPVTIRIFRGHECIAEDFEEIPLAAGSSYTGSGPVGQAYGVAEGRVTIPLGGVTWDGHQTLQLQAESFNYNTYPFTAAFSIYSPDSLWNPIYPVNAFINYTQVTSGKGHRH